MAWVLFFFKQNTAYEMRVSDWSSDVCSSDLVDLILSRIAHKHASLGITPDQYAIVHEHLFAAIVEILGDAVTPDVATAWDEVYWLMAETLITMERGLYQLAGVDAGDVWRTVRISERVLQSADTVSLTLTSLDGSALPTFAPGQYLSVGVTLPDGARQIRQYSLCSIPSSADWRTSVKRISGTDRKSVVLGKGVLGRVDTGVCEYIKKKKNKIQQN